MVRLSVLDQSTIVSGRSPDKSIRESIALAQYCEALGYARYWCAEHHNSDSQAGTAPEILIAAIAATTHRIRVGSAGVMLPHYSALKVAEQFRVLDAIAPGRIDLELGRAPGSDGRTAYALNPGRKPRRTTSRPTYATCWRGCQGRNCRRPPVPRNPRAARRPDHAGGLDPGQFRLWRPGRGLFRLAVLLRPFHHRWAGRAGAGDLSRRLSAQRATSVAARGLLRMGDGGGDPGGGRLSVSVAGDVAVQPGPGSLHFAGVSRGSRGAHLFGCRTARIERLRSRALYGTADVVAGKLRHWP